jgi:hypothetical protein
METYNNLQQVQRHYANRPNANRPNAHPLKAQLKKSGPKPPR